MKKFIIFFILVLITACSNMSQETLEEAASKANEKFKLSKKEQKIIDASNDFSIKLFKELEKSQADSSMMLAPMGIVYSLNIINNGASGATQDQLCKLLGYSKNDLDTVNAFCRRMIIGQYAKKRAACYVESNGDMKSSCLLAIDKKMNPKDDLLPLIRKDYFANTMVVDMASNAQEKINQWCYQQTDSIIKEIPLDLDKNTSACLINTTIFKAAWIDDFKLQKERKTFYKENGEKVKLPMMHQKDSEFRYKVYENKLFSTLRLRYCGPFWMTILLPNKGKKVADILHVLSPKMLKEIKHPLKNYDTLDITIPKFTIKSTLELSQHLRKLGANKMFSDKSQIAGFTEKSLKIDKFLQQSEMIVNEKGTQIKSVTESGYLTLAEERMIPAKPIIYRFKADRPFVFLITDYFGNICFMGQYQGD